MEGDGDGDGDGEGDGEGEGEGDAEGGGCIAEVEEKRMSCSAYRCISAGETTRPKSLRRRNCNSSWFNSVRGRPPTFAYREFV